MQTYSQTFAANTTWELNVPGKYFTTLECTLPVNVRFYKGGTLLDAGDIRGLLSGLECTLGEINNKEPAFDRVQIDVQAGDTVKVGIGNGQSRYNRGSASVSIVQNKAPQSANFDNQNKSVTLASTVLLAAKADRQYLLIQNNHGAGNLWIAFGKAATTTAGVRIIPGGFYLLDAVCTTQEVRVIGDVAHSAIVTVEG